jgi:hypothetical protein
MRRFSPQALISTSSRRRVDPSSEGVLPSACVCVCVYVGVLGVHAPPYDQTPPLHFYPQTLPKWFVPRAIWVRGLECW